jgi:hypothetical protein
VPQELARGLHESRWPLTGARNVLPLHTWPGTNTGRTSGLGTPPGARSDTASSATAPQSESHSTSVTTEGTAHSPCQIYWCVDRSWSEPTRTDLCIITKTRGVRSDSDFFKRLKQDYDRVRGLRGRIFSWKKCMEVKFVHVRFTLIMLLELWLIVSIHSLFTKLTLSTRV